MADNNILNNPMFAQFFMSKEEREAKQRAIEQKEVHTALTNLYTRGARITGLEEVTTKDLYAFFYETLVEKRYNEETMNKIVGEISARVLKRLKTPAVEVYHYIDLNNSVIATVASTRLANKKIDENTVLDINLSMARELSLFAVFHECKHLTQKYAMHNFVRGFKTDDHDLINGLVNYLSLSTDYKYFSYEHSIDELDANIFAYNLVKYNYEKGLFDEQPRYYREMTMLYNYIQAYEMLKKYKVINGQIDSKLQKEIINAYKQGVQDLKNSKMFTQDQLQKFENLNLDSYFKTLNKQLACIEQDFKLATIDYQKKYGIKFIDKNTIDEEKLVKTLVLIKNKIMIEQIEETM